ncbi:hypothetical protein C1645_330318 [Glomus cerebriforme]|uniref:Uncharacterized protein n=1 Tax=Glomus cerebriforme TaxID=658196 RepID=A0A397SU93_9GLOM|nr:hypothetical protein C1645_330318 [Glomus cerebriforme]
MRVSNNIKLISPYSVSPSPMRMPHALENVIKSFEMNGSDDKKSDNIKTKVILILMGKAGEQGYSYRETRDQKSTDLRDMINEIAQRDTLKRVKHCHFDVLRVMSSYETVGRDISWTKINVPNVQTEFSMTLYNIPPGRRCLMRSMLHLVQLHLNLNSLRLLEVPMKKSNNTKSAYEVNLLYPAEHHTPRSTEASKTRIYEVDHLNYRQIVLKWIQRLHGLDQLVTSCTHMVTPTEISPPTRALMSSLMKGAIYALADASELSNICGISNIQNESGKSAPFSHIILFRQDSLYLHCQHINYGHNVHFEDAMYFNNKVPFKLSMFKSVASNDLMFFEKHIIRPNSIMNNMSSNYIRNVNNIQIPERKGQLIQTTLNLDIETRWLLSMLRSNSDDNIKLQIGLNAGTPVYEIISHLKNLLCVDIPCEDGVKIINEILDRLLVMGRRSDSFQDQKNANVVLKQMPSIAEVFQSSSPMHGEICDVILARIRPDGTENKRIQQSQSDTSNFGPSSESMLIVKEELKEPQPVWQQLDQFNSMTSQEKQDFLDGQELSPLSLQVSQQIHTRNRISSYRGKARGYPSFEKSETFLDTIRHPPAPYLRIKPVDEKITEKDNYMKRLGNPKSLLYQYWFGKQNKNVYNR